MKTNVLKISILPLIFLVAISFTGIPPQKEKGNKSENPEKGNQNPQQKGNNKSDNSSRSNNNNDQGRSDDRDVTKGRSDNNSQGNNKNDQGNNNNKNKSNSDDRMNGSDNDRGFDKSEKGNDKNKENGKSRWENVKWDKDDNINWGFEDYANRKRPKDNKKVTICHNTGDRNFPVMINVSENAVKAHMNHGDQMGNCTTNYSDRWPANYIRTRENVYNNYQNTWETMSYSESLLRFAADKLLGIRSSFQTQRPTLSSQEIQRKEVLILDLQNNVNSLENQLAMTRQRTDGINININL
ncbi:hypothetical protein [Daejeonella sp.]|uniref:hypothetical protein n=1 Tax=Daejeonella sp. TaxID=2805397 RepID=UPI003983C0A3